MDSEYFSHKYDDNMFHIRLCQSPVHTLHTRAAPHLQFSSLFPLGDGCVTVCRIDVTISIPFRVAFLTFSFLVLSRLHVLLYLSKCEKSEI